MLYEVITPEDSSKTRYVNARQYPVRLNLNDVITSYSINYTKLYEVVNLAPYGAFVELEEGVEGLVHVSEMSWTKRIQRAADVLSVGQEVDAVVLAVSIV